MRQGEAPLGRLWAAFFVYAASVALLVQLVLLPYVFPAWHAGDGLLVGGDWVGFHSVARSRAEWIRTRGWEAFELALNGQALAGIASAVYAVTVPKPWTLIPLNAAVHATTGVVLLRIIQTFVADWRVALWATLPFMFYPSTLSWLAQIHKDGLFIAGFVFILYGWMRLAPAGSVRTRWTVSARACLLVLCGIFLMWLVRPYQMALVQGVEGLLGGIVVVAGAVQARRDPPRWRRALGVSLLAGVLIVVPGLLPVHTPLVARPPDVGDVGGPGGGPVVLPRWEPTRWLPLFVESRAYGLAVAREYFRASYPEAKSNVDIDVSFRSVWDILRYLPRATEIALLAPFPLQWLEPGSLPSTTMMRRVAAVEMLGVYLALLCLPVALWLWRDRLELWLLVLSSVLVMEVYALAVPNLGALYRFRYGFIMLLVSMGVAGALALRARLSRAVATPGAEGASALPGKG